MKKITFFLSALLISVMSFAADYPATNTSNVSFTLGTKAYDNKIMIEGTEYQAIKLGANSAIGDMSFTVPANTAKIHLHIAGWSGKNSAVTISASNGVALGTTEITATSDAGMTGNSPFTLSDASKVTKDYYHVIELGSPTTAETTITMTSVSGKYRVVIWGVNTEEATSGEQGETVDAPTFSATEANFTEAFNLTITSAEGTTLKYTTDKTDPTTSATAVVVESNTVTVAIPAKSTRVMAVAIKGELVSNVTSMTYCYVNSEATAYTVTEALAIYNEGLGLSNKLYIKGSVKSIEELNKEYGNATYTITDGESDLYIYRGKNFGGEKFTSADQLFVNDDLVLYGQLTSYNGNPQVAANSEIISRESKTKSILAEDLTFDAIALGDEVEAQTLTVTGANLTADIAATLDNEKFTVTPATLPAAGGDLTITPAADLTAGEHTAILTLTSGETVKEVALSILVKDVYSINWSVNGTIANETKVVAGDKLVLPVAPAAPDACSEKVFVGWATTSTVNADGSKIEYVTSATVPTESTTYYAVFATQESEGSQEEVTITPSAVEGSDEYVYTLDVDGFTLTALKNSGSTAPTYNANSEDVRVYAKGSLTLTATNAMSTIVFNLSAQGKKRLAPITASVGTITTQTTEDEMVTWIGNATEVTFTVGDKADYGSDGSDKAGQLCFTSITVVSGTAATYTDYSTTCEAEIEWMEMPLEISNLTTMEMPVDDVTYLQLMGRNDMDDADVMLFLNNYTGEEKAYEVNAESSYMTFGGLELTVMDGSITKSVDPELGDVYAGVVHASVYDDMMGGTMYLALSLTMYGAEPVEVVVENATVVIEERSMGFGDATYSVLILTGEWSDGETTYPVSLVTSEFDPEQESQEVAATLTVGGEGDEDPWLGSGEGNATIAIVDNTVSVSGLFENQYTGFAANATISGTLVITWELNGGELPTATVPTQDSLIAAFKDGYNAYFGVSVATTRAIDNFLYAGAAVNDPTCDVSLFMKDDASPWKWLGDYVLAVTNAQIEAGLLVNLKELATELMWRQSLTGFFLQQAKLDSNYNGNADFTEAGKPEAWGAAYQAAHAVVLPTEPVDAPYTLPTPVKDGFTFVGWYDNAEGTGEAYTVIPAGWAGTLYAIWKQGPTTALENIAVEGKAVKAIINGQLIIIKNGVQYNAQGQVVK